VFTLPEGFNDQDEIEESKEDDIELFKSGEDTTESF